MSAVIDDRDAWAACHPLVGGRVTTAHVDRSGVKLLDGGDLDEAAAA
jgi:hypothetical protein